MQGICTRALLCTGSTQTTLPEWSVRLFFQLAVSSLHGEGKIHEAAVLPCRTMYSLHMTARSLTTRPSCLAGALVVLATPFLAFLWTCTDKVRQRNHRLCFFPPVVYTAYDSSFACVGKHL